MPDSLRAQETPYFDPPAADPSPNHTLPQVPGFEVQRVLGEGGMGIVYLARQQGLGREVALKMIRGHHGINPEVLARFRREAEAVARLHHPHVVQVHAWGEHEGMPYLAFEYCSGGSLYRATHGQAQSPEEAARLVEKLARAVHAAHEAGIIHRDLKPGNVLLAAASDEPALNTPWGVPKVADFGLCRALAPDGLHTTDGLIMGSPAYMAPEQARGEMSAIGPATDVWSLGAMLYELLTGRTPFPGPGTEMLLYQVCHEPIRPLREATPEVPATLESICLKCLKKDPAERFAHASELAAALHDWLARVAVTTQSPAAKYPDRRPPGGVLASRVRWLALATILVLAASAAVLFLLHQGKARGPGQPESLGGWLDLQIYDEKDPARQDRWLGEPGVLPLRAGDKFCIRAELNRPAYLYVLWIDAHGKVDLAYPRDPITKGRAEEQHAVQGLRRPERLDRYYEIPAGTAGMETVLMLARDEPLPKDVDLRAELAGLPPQRRQGEAAVVWFRNGEVVHDEAHRLPRWDETGVNDPLRVTQERLRQLWHRHGGLVRAISFSNLGLSGNTVNAYVTVLLPPALLGRVVCSSYFVTGSSHGR